MRPTLSPAQLAALDAIIIHRSGAPLSANDIALVACRTLGLKHYLGRQSHVAKTMMLGRAARAGASRKALLAMNAAATHEIEVEVTAALELLIAERMGVPVEGERARRVA